jgi:hypothetical protein
MLWPAYNPKLATQLPFLTLHNLIIHLIFPYDPLSPGQTIRLADNKEIRMPDIHRISPKRSPANGSGAMKTLPQSIARGSPTVGPRKDRKGAFLSHTLLGSVEEFQAEEMV